MGNYYFTTGTLIIFPSFISCYDTQGELRDHFELKNQVQSLNYQVDSLISIIFAINESNTSIPAIKKSRIKQKKVNLPLYTSLIKFQAIVRKYQVASFPLAASARQLQRKATHVVEGHALMGIVWQHGG